MYPFRSFHCTVICLHCGGWVMGSRKTNLPLMIKLAEEGYAAVSVQYRLGSRFPAAVHEVKCAVCWLRANAVVFSLDGERIAALGYSSDGTTACLLGLTTSLDGLEVGGGVGGPRRARRGRRPAPSAFSTAIPATGRR